MAGGYVEGVDFDSSWGDVIAAARQPLPIVDGLCVPTVKRGFDRDDCRRLLGDNFVYFDVRSPSVRDARMDDDVHLERLAAFQAIAEQAPFPVFEAMMEQMDADLWSGVVVSEDSYFLPLQVVRQSDMRLGGAEAVFPVDQVEGVDYVPLSGFVLISGTDSYERLNSQVDVGGLWDIPSMRMHGDDAAVMFSLHECQHGRQTCRLHEDFSFRFGAEFDAEETAVRGFQQGHGGSPTVAARYMLNRFMMGVLYPMPLYLFVNGAESDGERLEGAYAGAGLLLKAMCHRFSRKPFEEEAVRDWVDKRYKINVGQARREQFYYQSGTFRDVDDFFWCRCSLDKRQELDLVFGYLAQNRGGLTETEDLIANRLVEAASAVLPETRARAVVERAKVHPVSSRLCQC